MNSSTCGAFDTASIDSGSNNIIRFDSTTTINLFENNNHNMN